jgi:hypothetical protein
MSKQQTSSREAAPEAVLALEYAVFLEGMAARALEDLQRYGIEDWDQVYALYTEMHDDPGTLPVRRLGWDLLDAFRPLFEALRPEAELDEETAHLLRSPANAARLLRALLRSRLRNGPVDLVQREVDGRTLSVLAEAAQRLDVPVEQAEAGDGLDLDEQEGWAGG